MLAHDCPLSAVPGTALNIWLRSLGYCRSVAKSCLTICDPTTATRQAPLSFTISRSLLKLMSIDLVMRSNHLILCHPLLQPSIFPSIGSFQMSQLFASGGQSIWSFSFSISSANEYSGLISFGMDWFDLLAVQGTLKHLSNTTNWRGWESGSISFLLLIRYVVLSKKLAEPVSFSLKWVYVHACLAETSGFFVCAQLLSRVRVCGPLDHSPAGSSVHGISQARRLEWVSASSSRGIFRAQQWNPCLLCLSPWQAHSLPLSRLGSPQYFKGRIWWNNVWAAFASAEDCGNWLPRGKKTSFGGRILVLQNQTRSLHWWLGDVGRAFVLNELPCFLV